MSSESEFSARADAVLAAVGAALDEAIDASDADLDWSLNEGVLTIDCGRRRQAHRQSPRAEPRNLGGGEIRRLSLSRGRRRLARFACAARSSAPRSCVCCGTRRGMTRRPGPRCRRLPANQPSSGVSASSSRRGAVVAGQERLEQRPEAWRMVELDQVRDLVRDHVVGDARRQLHQPPMQPDLALLVAAAPLRTRAG